MAPSSPMTNIQSHRCKNLVLDAGPFLALSPIRGLAETYYTVPQVLAELKDRHTREHFEKLGSNAGIRIEVKEPPASALSHVIQFAKKTGDYAVLSHADLCILALTYALDLEAKEDVSSSAVAASPLPTHTPTQDHDGTTSESPSNSDASQPDPEPSVQSPVETSSGPIFDDPSDEDDSEGEWITPSNVAVHKSRNLNLLPNEKCRSDAAEIMHIGCMTSDFAMQNVLLQMGLNLVSVDGKRIEKLKTWVLRCHACFKVCKDNSKKFCPSCGNPTLLRASVTLASPTASPDAPVMTVHLKKNFQYRLRGTVYSIPSPKPGSAKGGPGEGLILREDQTEWIRATKKAESKREKEEKKIMKEMMGKGGLERGVATGSWMDPDWLPGMLSNVSIQNESRKDGMPAIGYGKRNPNERRRKKK